MTDTPVFLNAAPSWAAILPILIGALDSNRFEARQIAVEELRRMAELADAYVATTLTKKDQAND